MTRRGARRSAGREFDSRWQTSEPSIRSSAMASFDRRGRRLLALDQLAQSVPGVQPPHDVVPAPQRRREPPRESCARWHRRGWLWQIVRSEMFLVSRQTITRAFRVLFQWT